MDKTNNRDVIEPTVKISVSLLFTIFEPSIDQTIPGKFIHLRYSFISRVSFYLN